MFCCILHIVHCFDPNWFFLKQYVKPLRYFFLLHDLDYILWEHWRGTFYELLISAITIKPLVTDVHHIWLGLCRMREQCSVLDSPNKVEHVVDRSRSPFLCVWKWCTHCCSLFKEFNRLICSQHTAATQWADADLQLIPQLPAQASNLKDQPVILHVLVHLKRWQYIKHLCTIFPEHAIVFQSQPGSHSIQFTMNLQRLKLAWNTVDNPPYCLFLTKCFLLHFSLSPSANRVWSFAKYGTSVTW